MGQNCLNSVTVRAQASISFLNNTGIPILKTGSCPAMLWIWLSTSVVKPSVALRPTEVVHFCPVMILHWFGIKELNEWTKSEPLSSNYTLLQSPSGSLFQLPLCGRLADTFWFIFNSLQPRFHLCYMPASD